MVPTYLRFVYATSQANAVPNTIAPIVDDEEMKTVLVTARHVVGRVSISTYAPMEKAPSLVRLICKSLSMGITKTKAVTAKIPMSTSI